MGKGRRATGPRAAAMALVAVALAGAAAGQGGAGRPGALCAEAEGVARGGSAQARRDYEALCGEGGQPQAPEEGGPRGQGRGRGLHQAAAGARPAVSNLRRADGSSEVRLTAYGADGAAAEFKVGPGGAEYGGQTLDERFQRLEGKNGELEGNVTVLKQTLATVYSMEFQDIPFVVRNATTSYLVQLDFPFVSRAPPLPTQFTATSSNESLVQVEFLPGEGPARTLRLVPKAWESYGLSSYNFAAEISLSASTAYSSASAVVQATIASTAGTLGWSAKANMPTAMYLMAAAAIDGKIYVVGGWNGSAYQSALEVYDPATNTWSTKTNMPTATHQLAAAAIDGKLYVVGGRNEHSYATGLDVLEVYDPVTDTWSTKANMPTARQGLAAVPIFGSLYAVGGQNSEELSKKLEVYDPVTDTWSTLDDMPTARKWLAAAVIDGKIYAAGGELSADDTTSGHSVNVLEMTL